MHKNAINIIALLLALVLFSCGGSSSTGVTGDTSGGATATFVINSGAAYATSPTVTLSVSATGSVSYMQFSEDVNFVNVQWESFQATKQYTFSHGGTATVYAKFQGSNGASTSPLSASIYIDTDPRATIITPYNNAQIVTTMPVLVWEYQPPIPNPTYHVQIASDTGFSIGTIKADIITAPSVTQYAYTGAPLDDLATYYWRVAIIDNTGHEWGWSDATSFSVNLLRADIVSPLDGATGVDRATVITATFDRNLNAATIQSPATSFMVNNGVSGTVSYDQNTKTATFTPAVPLAASTTYTVTITGAQDTAGNVMVDKIWTFTTNSLLAWYHVDGNGANGINKDATKNASAPQLTDFNSKLYATWVESNANASQIRVKVYNGNDAIPVWTFVDGGGANGINKDNSQNAVGPQLVVFNSKLYATWSESNSSASQIRVAVYNGNDSAPAWTFVDGGVSNGINKDSSQNASNPQLAVFNSKLYSAWAEVKSEYFTEIRLAVYNGNDSAPAWTLVDGSSISCIGNNIHLCNAISPFLAEFNSKLYITWDQTCLDPGDDTNIFFSVYNGDDASPVWTSVGGIHLTLTFLPLSSSPQLTVYNSKLYSIASYYSNSWSYTDLYVYNGSDSAPAWTALGFITRTVSEPRLISFNSKLYAVMDGYYMAEYNGDDSAPAWTYRRLSGLNWVASPQLTTSNGKLYMTWLEGNGNSINQMRAAVWK